MIAVKKETLEDSLTGILWYYLNNDFNLNMVARELFSRESAALALQTGHSVDEFLKSGAYLLKNYIAVSFMPGSVNPLYMDAKFSSSQLVAMLKLNDEVIAQVDPNATIKDIKKLSASKTSEVDSSDESEEDEENEDADKKEKKEKKNVRDMNIPVMRLNMATGATWESVVTDAIRKVCEPFLNDERRAADTHLRKDDIMIYFLSINVEPLTPPSIDGFFSGSILTSVSNFFNFIFTFISNIVSALTNLYDTLVEINTYVVQLGNSAQSGVASDLPVLQCVGTYRYLMGDPVFYMTYIMVVTGCLFTIYKLTLLLIKVFKEMKNNITSQGKTSAGLMSFLSQLFK